MRTHKFSLYIWMRLADGSHSYADPVWTRNQSLRSGYLDEQLQLQWGEFVAKLEFIDRDRVKQDDQQLWFTGPVPNGLDGKELEANTLYVSGEFDIAMHLCACSWPVSGDGAPGRPPVTAGRVPGTHYAALTRISHVAHRVGFVLPEGFWWKGRVFCGITALSRRGYVD